jgi:hypothetical protein
MAYATLVDVKEYLGIAAMSDDALLESFITRATGVINSYTGRIFEAETATKYFGADAVDGKYLYLFGYDLLAVTTLTNGDEDTTEIASANYKLMPRNETPKWAIKLDDDTDWELYDADSEIIVAGTWGYSTIAPADIAHACVRLTAFLYRQKDTSADIDRPFVTGDGVTIMPASIPQDVKSILDNYRRRIP